MNINFVEMNYSLNFRGRKDIKKLIFVACDHPHEIHKN